MNSVVLFVTLAVAAMTANADVITEFTATSNLRFSMDVIGVDSQGDSIEASFRQGDIGSEICPCKSGQAIQVFEQWDYNGVATVNGVTYADHTILNQNEVGFTIVDGVLPPITAPAGSHVLVTFPITWRLGISFLSQGPDGIPFTLFSLSGSGTGTASTDMEILDVSGNLIYEPSPITFTSDVPEPSTAMLLGMGLLAVFVSGSRPSVRSPASIHNTPAPPRKP